METTTKRWQVEKKGRYYWLRLGDPSRGGLVFRMGSEDTPGARDSAEQLGAIINALEACAAALEEEMQAVGRIEDHCENARHQRTTAALARLRELRDA